MTVRLKKAKSSAFYMFNFVLKFETNRSKISATIIIRLYLVICIKTEQSHISVAKRLRPPDTELVVSKKRQALRHTPSTH